jgi:hypothetical protein
MDRIEELHRRLERIEDKLDKLQEFKTTSIVSARWISFVVSGLCGLATMIASHVVNYYALIKTK